MRTVETSGADIEEAIEKGLQLLDVARENVIVEIIEEPSRGVLGLGSKEALVRLTTVVPPRSERPQFVSSVEETTQEREEPRQEQRRDRDDGGRRQTYRDGDRGDRRGRGSGGRNFRGERGDRRGGDQRGGRDRSDRREEERRLREELEKIEPRRVTVAVENEDDIPEGVRVGAETLSELLEHMKVDAQIVVERIVENGAHEIEIPWLLHIRGDDLGRLIGRSGETLSALQYLTRLIASRDIQSRAEFSIDVEDYRAKREIQLEQMARSKAEEAVQKSRTVYLAPMSPNERRIIHMTLRENPDVTTESEGEGPRRRVTIIPKNQ
ncbi:MAG: Jag N-terminal domain-containing protein [Chloroflexi bacterium]|nr:Jag N-terminal domain-containing protein [Chloroflexota bacterium]